jgi:hypothetical protein
MPIKCDSSLFGFFSVVFISTKILSCLTSSSPSLLPFSRIQSGKFSMTSMRTRAVRATRIRFCPGKPTHHHSPEPPHGHHRQRFGR